MLRLSGWLLGKLSRELQSHTGAPNVSAIAITCAQPRGGLAAKSAMTTGRSAAASASGEQGGNCHRDIHRARVEPEIFAHVGSDIHDVAGSREGRATAEGMGTGQ